MIKLFTIGFTQKSAKIFFKLLTENGVEKVIDTRIHPNSQLSGFAKARDLEYFLKTIGKISYQHVPAFCPSEEILKEYRDYKNWDSYTKAYLELLEQRKITVGLDFESLHNCCLLSSEHSPEKCHRKLLADFLKSYKKDIEIIHLL